MWQRVFGLSGGGFEGDLEPVGLELGDAATSLRFGIDAGGEVVGAEILVGPAGGQHGARRSGSVCARLPRWPSSSRKAAEPAQLADLAAVELAQTRRCAPRPRRTRPGPAADAGCPCGADRDGAFAGRFVVAGAQPGQEARCSAEGNQAAGSAPISPMTAAEPCPAIPGTDWSARAGHKRAASSARPARPAWDHRAGPDGPGATGTSGA